MYQITKTNHNIMTNLTITVPGTKAGELVYFFLNIAKANFLEVIEMEWNNVADVLEGEKKGLYTVSK